MTSFSRNQFYAAAIVALLPATAAQAVDIITVRGASRRLSGDIVQVSKTSVVIKAGIRKNKQQTVPVNDILLIQWNGEPAKTDEARNDERKGKLKQALDGYTTVLANPKVTNENLRTDLTYFIARTTAKMALNDPAKIDDALAKLEAFRSAHGNSYHYYESLMHSGRVLQAKRDFAQAKATFRKIGQAPWPDVKLAARNAEAGVLLEENQPGPALTIFTDVLAQSTDSPVMKNIRVDATLGKAACLHKTSKNQEAVKVLEGVIENAGKTDSRTMAGAYVLQGDCFQALNQKKDALLAYLHVDVLFENEVEYHPRALYHLSKLWVDVGKGDRAGVARQKLDTLYPNSQWAKKR